MYTITVGVARDTPCSRDYHVVSILMALAKEDEFAVLPPPLGVLPSSTNQQSGKRPLSLLSSNGSGVQLFHEIGGNVFEIPPLPDDFDEFSLSPDAVKTSSNEGIFNLPPMGGVMAAADDPNSSQLPPPLTDSSSLPPPLTDLSMEEPEFAPFTAAPVDPVSLPPPLPNITSSSLPISGAASSNTNPSLSTVPSSTNRLVAGDSEPTAKAASSKGWQGNGDDDGFDDFSSFQSNAIKEPVATIATSASSSSIMASFPVAVSTSDIAATPIASVADPTSTVTMATSDSDMGFADFSSWSTAGEQSHKPSPALLPSSSQDQVSGSDDFGDFDAFSDPVSTAAAAASQSVGVIQEEFEQFTTATAAPPPAAPSSTTAKEEGFGAFSGGGGDFDAFSDPVSTSESVVVTNTTATVTSAAAPSTGAEEDGFGAFSGGGDFGEFSAVGVSSTSVTEKDDKGFGNFQGDDDFGEFGSFSAPPPAVSSMGMSTASPPTARSMGTSTSQPASQVPKDVMFMCFPSVAMDAVVGVASSNVLHITQYLQSSSNCVWSTLSAESASTNSLYQWKQSLLQDHFYTSLNVDPMLAPAVKTSTAQTPIYSQQLSDGLLSPGTGLLEGFGFESIAKPEPQTKMMDTAGDTAFGWDGSSQGATLLDLSLPPSSPSHQSEQGVSLDADLVGLDFTSAPSHTESLSTTTDLSSTWMDAELLELGMEATTTTAESEVSRVQPTAGPVASVEEHLVQLGLDTSKTTWRQKSPDSHQLSEAARTLLEKLPDLSFMICEPPSEIL